MSQAEHLLINTDFTMGQIAQMIGYTTSSRFAELFKKSTGILPIEYRRIARSAPRLEEGGPTGTAGGKSAMRRQHALI